jgi:hypothetical protein
MTQRGRPRKHHWLELQDLEESFSQDAQYLKWASANNMALQTLAATGCPRCHSLKSELRHDPKFKIIRFHCLACHHETSYRIKMPKPGSFYIVPVLTNGIQVGEKIVDSYHVATRRERSDALVARITQGVDSGRASLGGEWYVDGKAGGAHDQKRYFTSMEDVRMLCNLNRMRVEHEKRLRELEREAKP